MALSDLLAWLTQREAEADEEFRAQLDAYSRRGLRIVGYVELAFTAVAAVLKLVGFAYPHENVTIWWPTFLFAGLGLASLACAKLLPDGWSRGVAVAIATATLLAIVSADISATGGQIGDKLLANVLTVMLVAVACIPLTPLLSLMLNALAVVVFVAAWEVANDYGLFVPEASGTVLLSILAALCTFLGAVNYERVWTAFRHHREALIASDEVRQSQLRACTAENAMSHVRLAAALSHELNSPLGALNSAIQTMVAASSKIQTGTAGERDTRLVQALQDAASVAKNASSRLSSVVHRIQRFSNLDGATEREIDVAAMLKDIVALYQGEVVLETLDLPRVTGSPEVYSSMFSTLLLRLLDAAGPGGRVMVRGQRTESAILLQFDYGTAGAPVDFDLGFGVDDGRVNASNWDMFNARQVIRAHGGDIVRAGAAMIQVRLPIRATQPERPRASYVPAARRGAGAAGSG